MKVRNRFFARSSRLRGFRLATGWLALCLLPLSFGIAEEKFSEAETNVFHFDPASLPVGSYEQKWHSIWTSHRQAWRIELLHGFPHLVHRSSLDTPRGMVCEEAGEAENAEILARTMTTSDRATQSRFMLRAGGRAGEETAYQFDFRPNNVIRISRYLDGAFQRIGDNVSWPRDLNRWYWVRFRVEGNELKARIWADGDPEPGDWTIEREDDAISAPGGVGIGSYAASGTRYYDHIQIATNGASAETPETPQKISQVRLRHRHGDPLAVAASHDSAAEKVKSILVPVDTARPHIHLDFHAREGLVYPISEDEYEVNLVVADPSVARFEIREGNPFAADLHGLQAGSTSFVVRCLRNGVSIFESEPIPLEVSGDREWRDYVDRNTSFPWAEPETVGMSAEGLEEMKRTLRHYVATEEIVGGTMMVVRNGRLVLFETNGWNDIENGLPLRPDQIYQVRSMTKKATGVSLLMLMEQGLLHPSDPVSKHLEAWDTPESRNITVHQLLSHTAGLRGSIDRSATSILEAGKKVGRRGPTFEPGSRYRYSDAGSTSVGALVALLSGHEGCEPFKHARIFKPLQMHDTFCSHAPEGDPRIERVAARYSGGKGNWSKYSEVAELEGDAWCRASGGTYSTVLDWSRFMAALLNGGEFEGTRLLKPETVELATQVPHSAYAFSEEERAEETRYYGYHFEMVTDRFGKAPSPMSPSFFGHGGSDGLFAFADPEYDLIALFFTQSRFHRRTGENSRERFFELVYEAIEE